MMQIFQLIILLLVFSKVAVCEEPVADSHDRIAILEHDVKVSTENV